jgi:hypothetical protein
LREPVWSPIAEHESVSCTRLRGYLDSKYFDKEATSGANT